MYIYIIIVALNRLKYFVKTRIDIKWQCSYFIQHFMQSPYFEFIHLIFPQK